MTKNKNLNLDVKKYLLNNESKIKINSIDICKGDVFVALAGSNTHGNDYIQESIFNGAKFIITDKKFDENLKNEIIILVEDVFNFLLSVANYKRNLYKGIVIGITGSIGKTTLKENLKFIISQTSTVSASIQSYNNYLGIIISLININLSSNFAVFEMGTNNFKEIRNLTSIIMPSQVIITNIFPVHLKNLKNTRNIAIEKSDIFNPEYNSNIELLIIPQNNIDEIYISKLAKKQKITKIITFGKNDGCDCYIKKINRINDSMSDAYINYEGIDYNFKIKNNQFQKISNILISLIISNYNNLGIDNSLTKNFKLIEGRGLESKIFFKDRFINLIDESYNASPQTMKISVDYLNQIKIKNNQKKVLILGDMKELGVNEIKFHIEILKHVISLNINDVIICGKLMKSALNKLKKKNSRIKFMSDKKSILTYLEKTLNNEDILLVKGSNTSLTKNITMSLLKKGEN